LKQFLVATLPKRLLREHVHCFTKKHEGPVPKLFQNPMFLWPRGLLRARSRFPEIVENAESVVKGMERLDGAVELAKQVFFPANDAVICN
jgi:hypothetical protein